jgi:hypothetical protein
VGNELAAPVHHPVMPAEAGSRDIVMPAEAGIRDIVMPAEAGIPGFRLQQRGTRASRAVECGRQGFPPSRE